MVLCTGTLDAVNYNAASISELSVRDLTANVPSVTLGGSSSQPIGAPGGVPACSIPNQCSFHRDEIARRVYCQVDANAPANIRCIEQVIQSGPSGMVGPNSSVNVQTSTFSITPGSVSGSSTGANGANGNNAGFSDATNGAPGADGGTTNVVVWGAVNSTSGTGGVTASSIGGNGGKGGDSCAGCLGAPGAGGVGGEGGVAQAALNSGSSISTIGANRLSRLSLLEAAAVTVATPSAPN